MIEEILPVEVIVEEARGDIHDVVLFPEEEPLVRHAVESRRREFTTVRACARRALARLGLDPQAIATGERGEPQWPAGVVGSMTHCAGYRGCAIAAAASILTIGIDAEPNAPLPDGVLAEIASAQELRWLHDLALARPDVHWDRLLFSAKESVYKAWFPLAKRWLGFEDAVVTADASRGTFAARLLIEEPPFGGGQSFTRFTGRWMVHDGLVLTAIALVSSSRSEERQGSRSKPVLRARLTDAVPASSSDPDAAL